MTEAKRDVVFYVADGAMEYVFKTFLGRDHFEQRLGCQRFSFDVARDPRATDGGLHKRAHEYLLSYQKTHDKAVVVLDQQFGGDRPAAEVQADIEANLRRSGWADADCAVVVIDPELEVWLWQDNPHVEQAIGHKTGQNLRALLADSGEWPESALKPLDPKMCIQSLIRRNRAGSPTVAYAKIAGQVSVKGCQDVAFQTLMGQLQVWFPLAYESSSTPRERKIMS